ncbi:MAG: G1 family endopeptidase [Actinomycetota bacterium]|nr:G1 family endopeptidase [Actinomycetota bacterium]
MWATWEGRGKTAKLLSSLVLGGLVGIAPFSPAPPVEAVMVPARPMVGFLSVMPPAVGPHGGTVTVSATLAGASSCRLKMGSHQSFPVVYPHGVRPCTDTFSAKVTVGANRSKVDRVVTLQLVMKGAGSQQQAVPVRIGVLDANRTPIGRQVASRNWSGYSVQGGPFQGASGTFTVAAAAPASCQQALGEWVGVDGFSDQDLVQAGISEGPAGPGGDCAGRPSVEAWWEVLPSAQQPISMKVAPGDVMTVALRQTGPNQWKISITDDTTGARFVHLEPYNGPAASVDWIVESPSRTNGTISSLMPYGQASFSNLQVDNSSFVTMVDQVLLVQHGSSPPRWQLPACRRSCTRASMSSTRAEQARPSARTARCRRRMIGRRAAGALLATCSRRAHGGGWEPMVVCSMRAA